jgi:hypothetical protein
VFVQLGPPFAEPSDSAAFGAPSGWPTPIVREPAPALNARFCPTTLALRSSAELPRMNGLNASVPPSGIPNPSCRSALSVMPASSGSTDTSVPRIPGSEPRVNVDANSWLNTMWAWNVRSSVVGS